MRTINTNYTTKENLQNFIKENKIVDSNSVLLQIFTGICNEEFIDGLLQDIGELLKHINIIGSSTDGEILEDNIYEKSTVLSFSIFNETKIEICSANQGQSSLVTAKTLINNIPNIDDARVAIVFVDGLNTNGEGFLRGFNKKASHIVVAGGLAGDNAMFKKTFVFTKNGIIEDGVVGAILYNDKLIVNSTLSFGWEAIGKEFTITKVVENVIYGIDKQTPQEIYSKYLGKDIARQLPAIGIEFPLIVKREGMVIARAVVGKNDDGSLVFAGNIKANEKAWFGYGNLQYILNNAKYTYEKVLRKPVESIFIYSCMARKKLLGIEILNEILPLTKLAPVSGFFTYGEFFNNDQLASNFNQLLNQTMTVLTLSEDESVIHQSENIDCNINNKNIQTTKALSHLIGQTTKEFQELNKELENKVQIEVSKNREKDQAMLHQSKLAQMGEMISMIAHQWRQPLNTISLRTAGLSLKCMLGDMDKELFLKELELIDGYSQHLSSTIDDFRNFFKKTNAKGITTLEDIIENTLDIIRVPIENKNIEIIVSKNCFEEFLSFPNEIKQVLLNLIKNAEDVLIEKKIEEPYIKIQTYKNDDFLVLEVSDNGGGVPKIIIDKIFDPYFSTKLEKDGTGLGLYMSKIIIQEHCAGKLNITNGDAGAIFKIEFKR
ncbi:MAG: FIST N-terminal domain-containing protein [Campylobacterota bacterium]|nr:FIST N-terminal domain-containing protein [Campylobacterota bacterium]